MDTLRQAMVAANNGSTTLNYKNIRDGKCSGLFTLIEEILQRTIVEGFQGDEYFNSLVDFRNVALGDKNLFQVEDSNLFVVADAADGTQGIRRQRLGGVSETSIPTTFKVVRIYEELNRVLSGQVDFNVFIQKVSESFRKKLLDDVYALWSTATANDFGGTTYFPSAGGYDEDALFDRSVKSAASTATRAVSRAHRCAFLRSRSVTNIHCLLIMQIRSAPGGGPCAAWGRGVWSGLTC